jgi:hypothetical protein
MYHRVSIADVQKRYFPPKRSNPQDTSCRYNANRQGGLTREGIHIMKACHLRVYYGPQEESAKKTKSDTHHDTITVPLMDVLPLLTDALQSQRTWLHDFADDELTISMDLYEVLLAYQHYRRPSA